MVFEGFDRFIEQGLIEELNKFSKIESKKKKRKFLLFGNEYKLIEPSIKERDVVYMSLTYHCQLYVPARLIKKTKTREKIKNWMILYLGDIPLMNSKGTFVINGNYRVVVNQILRSPGIYYTWERKPSGNIIYIGTIISDWGGRSRLEIKKKTKKIWIRVSRKKKISVLLFLLAMGLNSKDIFNYKNILAFFKYSEEYYTYFYWYGGKEEAILELYKELYISDEIEKENCEFYMIE